MQPPSLRIIPTLSRGSNRRAIDTFHVRIFFLLLPGLERHLKARIRVRAVRPALLALKVDRVAAGHGGERLQREFRVVPRVVHVCGDNPEQATGTLEPASIAVRLSLEGGEELGRVDQEEACMRSTGGLRGKGARSLPEEGAASGRTAVSPPMGACTAGDFMYLCRRVFSTDVRFSLRDTDLISCDGSWKTRNKGPSCPALEISWPIVSLKAAFVMIWLSPKS